MDGEEVDWEGWVWIWIDEEEEETNRVKAWEKECCWTPTKTLVLDDWWDI